MISKKAAYVSGGKGICGCGSILLRNPKENLLPSVHCHAMGGPW